MQSYSPTTTLTRLSNCYSDYTHNPLSPRGTKGDKFSTFIIHTPLYVESFSWLPLLKTSWHSLPLYHRHGDSISFVPLVPVLRTVLTVIRYLSKPWCLRSRRVYMCWRRLFICPSARLLLLFSNATKQILQKVFKNSPLTFVLSHALRKTCGLIQKSRGRGHLLFERVWVHSTKILCSNYWVVNILIYNNNNNKKET